MDLSGTRTGRKWSVPYSDALIHLLSVPIALPFCAHRTPSVFRIFRAVTPAPSDPVQHRVLVRGRCFAHVNRAALCAAGVRNASRSRSGRLLAQSLRIISTLDFCHELVGHLPIFLHSMIRIQELWRVPVDRSRTTHLRVHLGMNVNVWLANGVHWGRGGRRKLVVYVGGARRVMLLHNVFSYMRRLDRWRGQL